MSISAKAKELKAQGVDVVSMTAGEPDFDTPQIIKDACIKAIQEGKVRYLASSGLPELKTEIVKKFANNGINTKSENIIISTGAKFAIFQAITCLCGAGDEVVLFAPFWLSYEEMIKASGAKAVIVQTSMEKDFAPTKEDLEAAITEKTKLIIVNSPNNPTGAVYSKETLQMIADVAVQHNVMVLSDEIYEKLIYDEKTKHVSIASLNPQIAEITITVNGFSKAYAMTGWRIGFLAAPLWIAKACNKLQGQYTSGASSIAQKAAVAAFSGDQSCVEEMRKAFERRRDLIFGLVSEIPGMKVNKPHGAFYLFPDVSSYFGKSYETYKIATSSDLAMFLLEVAHVASVAGDAFGSPSCLRFSYATSDENLIEAMGRVRRALELLK